MPIGGAVTPAPSASTMPTISWPGTSGSFGFGNSPSTTCKSVRQTPHASMRTRTWPGPGTRSGRSSSTSGVLGPRSTMAFISMPPDSRRTACSAGRPPTLRLRWAIAVVAAIEAFRSRHPCTQAVSGPLHARERHRGRQHLTGIVELNLEVDRDSAIDQMDARADTHGVPAAIGLFLGQVETDLIAVPLADRIAGKAGV